jgi:LPXTG-motif cell wall-anchored protein
MIVTFEIRRLRATATVLVAMAALLTLAVSAAFAQYPPDEDFGVACTPADPQPGDTVACEVGGAQPNEDLEATATAEVAGVIYEAALTADAEGRADFAFDTEGLQDGEAVTVTVRGAESGEHSVEVVVDEDGEPVTDEDGEPIEAAPEADEDRLPVTGGQVILMSLVGIALVGGGLLALRKRSSVA